MDFAPRSVIGLDISELVVDDDGVPAFIPVCCRYIKKKAATVGIFRECGNQIMVQDLCLICSCRDIAFPIACRLNDVTSFLKEWLMKLPTPLITPSVVEKYLKENNRRSVVETLKHLDPQNRKSLAHLFDVAREILDHTAENKMTFGNLSICFLSSLTQQNKGVTYYPLRFFYNSCVELIDLQRSDFILEGPLVEEFCGQDDIIAPMRREQTSSSLDVRPVPLAAEMSHTPPICRPRRGSPRVCRNAARFSQIIESPIHM